MLRRKKEYVPCQRTIKVTIARADQPGGLAEGTVFVFECKAGESGHKGPCEFDTVIRADI